MEKFFIIINLCPVIKHFSDKAMEDWNQPVDKGNSQHGRGIGKKSPDIAKISDHNNNQTYEYSQYGIVKTGNISRGLLQDDMAADNGYQAGYAPYHEISMKEIISRELDEDSNHT